MDEIWGQFLLIAFLTLLNAFFASAEMAIVSLNKNRIKLLAKEGNKKAITILKLMDEPTKFLSTIQVGITLAGFFSSASAATGLSDDFGKYLQSFGVPYANEIALVLITLVLSYITLVFGELFPKRVALQKSEAIAMMAVGPVSFISKIASPFIKLLSASTNVLVKMTGIDDDDLEEKVSREEIKSLVEVGQVNGVINEIEKEMINSIFEFDNKTAEEIMTPRTAVYQININAPLGNYLDELLQEKYSRIPVYEEDVDNIIGVLYMKDFMLEARRVGFENVDIKSILHEPCFVPEKKKIDRVFKELQNNKDYIAILIDEYGGFSGIVTIEDLIEEITGEIEDESDINENLVEEIDPNTYIVSGLLELDDINIALGINIKSTEYDTFAGYIIDLFGRIPKEGEKKIDPHNSVEFQVIKVIDMRIDKVMVKLNK